MPTGSGRGGGALTRTASSTRAVAPSRRRPAARGVAVWTLSFVIIFWQCWRPAWSADETATVMVAHRPFSGVLRTFRFDAALEPYYLFIKLWSLPSTSHVWMRLPSVVATAGAVTALWVLTTRLVGRRAGIAATLIMLSLPATSNVGQEARPYAFGVLFVLLAVLCWADADLATDRWRRGRLALLFLLAGAAHSYALTIIPVLLVTSWLAPDNNRRREVAATAMSGAAAVALLSPYLVFVALHANGQPNPARVTIANIISTAGRVPVALLSTPLAVPCAAAALGLALAGIIAGWRRSGRYRRMAVLAAVWLFLPATLLCLLQMTTGSPGLVTRYWVFSLPAIPLAGAYALDELRARGRMLVATGLVIVAALAWPSQLFARGTNGQLGQGWLELPRVLALPTLHDAPLLTGSWNYHGLVSNDPAITARMPLVRDPDPSGRIVPQLAGSGSAAFQSLIHTQHLVVVLPTAKSATAALPTAQNFGAFGPELRYFPIASVECRYFGQALGVFTKSGLAAGDARRLIRQIEAISPANVRCAVPEHG